jgi:hypothetical protein
MKLLVTGDRNYTNYSIVYETIKIIQPTLVIHGACKGLDLLADKAAKALCIKTHSEPAKWDTYKKAAGPIRNRVMLEMKPDLVVGFHDNIASSSGTKDMLTAAINAGTVVWLVQRGLYYPLKSIPDLVDLMVE